MTTTIYYESRARSCAIDIMVKIALHSLQEEWSTYRGGQYLTENPRLRGDRIGSLKLMGKIHQLKRPYPRLTLATCYSKNCDELL